MEAKLNPALAADDLRVGFDGLPEREKPILACAFRGFVMDRFLAGHQTLPAGLDLGLGLRPVLSRFGCAEGPADLRALHRVARDYYARGVIFVKPTKPANLAVADSAAFVAACLSEDPELGNLEMDCGDGRIAVAEMLSAHGRLRVRSGYDVCLDEAFAVTGGLTPGSCPEATETNVAAVASFLRDASICLSEALYVGFREFRERLDTRVGGTEAGRWLGENGVDVLVRGSQYNLRPTKPGTAEWWSEPVPVSEPAPRKPSK